MNKKLRKIWNKRINKLLKLALDLQEVVFISQGKSFSDEWDSIEQSQKK